MSVGSPSRIRILLVEDHPMARAGLELFIQAYPDLLFLGQVGSGEEAIEFCERNEPDVIVMDMSLPKLDGREAARQLRADERTRAIPLVMISGYDLDSLPANDGLWDHYLGKPCPPEQLVSVIGRLVA